MAHKVERLSRKEQRRVKSPHLHSAVRRLCAGEDAPAFKDSRDYDVVLDDGTRLPPKKVFGLALEEALGIKARPGHFTSGWGLSCFELIEAAGYKILKKGEQRTTASQLAQALRGLPHEPNDEEAIEGNPAVAMHMRRERNRGLVLRKKRAFIDSHGRLFCEQCRMDPAQAYGDGVGDACIEVHHACVQVKDMNLGHKTKLSDLQCLCANCHRVEHRKLART
jgi:predicted HNH restriction endonuclease